MTKYPLFQMYQLEELSRLIEHEGGPNGREPYTVGYLLAVKDHRKPATATFRRNACDALNQTEEELFGGNDGTPRV
ncbi:MAG: hypothetical protein J3T61_03215 [Candidatus Brocadiales bacterium]|nr:hypothetical protein [Candidatus Bathyanammoxibius sp.]